MTETGTSSPETVGSVEHIRLTERWAAHNYHPLPVVVSSAQGAWVTDVDGKRYLDCLAGYSALSFGHGHPGLLAVAHEQLDRLTLTSRAFYNDQLGPFARDLAQLAGKEMVLPMNTGAEAVETAIKVSRRWGYEVKGVPDETASIIVMEGNFHGRTTTIVSFSTDEVARRHYGPYTPGSRTAPSPAAAAAARAPDETASIIVMEGNFHGRTTTIVSFSTDEVARRHYGPYTPGFRTVPYGDAAAVARAIDETTVAVLLEPIQGEAGVVIPPDGFLRQVRALCDERRLLMVADEIQSGLARTGRTFACDHEEVVPDIYILGKALAGALYPVSAIAADRDVLDVISPGSHGSTFGGNPLAAAIGREVVAMLKTGEFQDRAARLGKVLHAELQALVGKGGVLAVRCRGLWAGVDVDPRLMTGRELCEALMKRGVLAKDTHGSTIRLAPPLVVNEDDIGFLVEALRDVLADAAA